MYLIIFYLTKTHLTAIGI